MKRQALTLAVMIGFATFIAGSSAKAQTSGAPRLTANIPFGFNVGEKAMPAGEYTVRCTNPSSDQKILQFRSKDGESVLIMMNDSIDKAQDVAKLVFHRYGDQYFFAQAWFAESWGMQANKSKAEKLEAKKLAARKSEAETVAVKLHR